MNETLELMMNRKSIRAFQEKEIPAEVKETILSAAMRAPTAGNLMLYSILDVTEQPLKDKLALTCDHQPFIATAPMVLIFLADYRRWYRKFQQAGGNPHAPRLSDFMLSMNDTMIAAHAACMAAESLGVGSCYIGDIIEQWETHREIFQLPEYVAPVSMLVFGYPTQQQKERPLVSRFPKETIVFENQYRDLSEEELNDFCKSDRAKLICENKYTSEFALEMERSAKEILKNWTGKPKQD